MENLLHLTATIRPIARVASTALPTTSIYLLLGLPPTVTLQAPPKPPDESAKALAEVREALQVLGQEFRDFRLVTNAAVQNNHVQNFPPRN